MVYDSNSSLYPFYTNVWNGCGSYIKLSSIIGRTSTLQRCFRARKRERERESERVAFLIIFVKELFSVMVREMMSLQSTL